MSTPERVETALDAMTTEAQHWGDRRAVLEEALRAIRGLQLSSADFSFITEEAGTLDAYRQVEDRMSRLVEQGIEVSQDIQDRLVSTRDQSAADEEANVHAASGILLERGIRHVHDLPHAHADRDAARADPCGRRTPPGHRRRLRPGHQLGARPAQPPDLPPHPLGRRRGPAEVGRVPGGPGGRVGGDLVHPAEPGQPHHPERGQPHLDLGGVQPPDHAGCRPRCLAGRGAGVLEWAGRRGLPRGAGSPVGRAHWLGGSAASDQ